MLNGENGELADGNTVSSAIPLKRPNQKSKYDFTFNNYVVDDLERLETCFSLICKKWIWGEEVGETGTPHLQGAIWLKKPMRITELKFICDGKLSFRAIRNEKALIAYCQKDGTNIVKGGVGWPKEKRVYKGEDLPTILYSWEESLLKILDEPADDRTIHWIYEGVGQVGKSKFTKYLAFHKGAAVITKGKYSDIMNYVYEVDELDIFIVDIPRDSGNAVSYNALESIKGGIIFNAKYETGMKLIMSPHVVVFSNVRPNIGSLSLDRWKIWEIVDLKLILSEIEEDLL